MNNSQIKIFRIEPSDGNRYKTKIIYDDSEIQARISAHISINTAHQVPPLSERDKTYTLPKDDDIYKDQTRSKCTQIFPLIKNHSNNSVEIEHKGKIYYLNKGEAEDEN